MIKRCGYKACGLVTLNTIRIGGNMIAQFADGRGAVVAGDTIPNDALMFKVCLCK